MTRSNHDNYVLGYSVDRASREPVIRTEFRDKGEPFERTDVRFEGVLGYLIQDVLGGILFDTEQVDFDDVHRAWATFFSAGEAYAWPFQGCASDPKGFVEARGAATFEITSSIGFYGFVVCDSMTMAAGESGADHGRLPT